MKLQYKLRQETPMIHFQADEYGAILRATEVKPKLDRFIQEWCKEKEKYEVIPDNWKKKIDKENTALDYKMRIINKQNVEGKEVCSDLYFGNMGVKKALKMKQVLYEDAFDLHIICFHKDLREIIDKCIRLFFLTTNFGTRQNKGFGGFVAYTEGITEENITKEIEDAEKLLPWWYQKEKDPNTHITIYRIDYSKSFKGRDEYYSEIFMDIKIIYKVLKSGINYGKTYIKSYLTKYFLEKKIAGEKRYMKAEGISPNIACEKNEVHRVENKKYEGLEPRYIRGLFGTTEKLKYCTKYGKNKEGKIVAQGCQKISIKNTTEEIKRVPSPVLFKVVNKHLYIIPNNQLDAVYGAQFEFESENSKKGILSIPTKDEFNMNEFFEKYVNELNNSNGELYKELRDYREGKKRLKFIEKEITIEKCKEVPNV